MQVHYELSSFTKLDKAVATIGTFDGVHYGHQQIINKLTNYAHEINSPSVVITFWPHPRKIIRPEAATHTILFTLEERIALLSKHNIDHLVIIPFDLEFSKKTPDEFISQIIIAQIGATTLILGYDHKFGNNREGGFEYLQANAGRYGLNLLEIPKHEIDAIAVSSSRIRKAIGAADFETAGRLLGNKFYLTGTVVSGKMLGRQIGFPTANLAIDEDKILPPDGVYAVAINHEKRLYKGMLNIGYRPTVSGIGKSVEVNIFDFNQDIYGQPIQIIFEKKLRDEQKFDGIEALITQLKKDKLHALEILSDCKDL